MSPSKVYLVTCCYVEPERVIYGVFSSHEKAQEYVKATPDSDQWPRLEISEWVIDRVLEPEKEGSD